MKKAIFAIVLGGGLWGIGSYMTNQSIQEANETYNLSAEAQEVAGVCRASLERFDQEFSSGMSKVDGCACLASELAKTHADSTAEISVTVSYTMELAETEKELELMDLAKRADVELIEAMGLLSAFVAGTTTCAEQYKLAQR